MFDEDKFYFANDLAVLRLATYSTMAHWRCEGKGPAFHRIGSRIAYKGRDLNAWIDGRRVETEAA